MRLISAIVLAALSLSVTDGMATAQPNGIPVYPVERWCTKVSESAGRSEVIYGGCMQQEQEAYDALKEAWGDVPNKTRMWCDQVAHSAGSGSYVILKGCIDQEAQARKDNSTRQFKR